MEIDWGSRIREKMKCRHLPLNADINRPAKSFGKGAGRAVKLGIEERGYFAFKGFLLYGRPDKFQEGRILFNDNVAGRLGILMGAPVPKQVAFVDVSQEFINKYANEMKDLRPGIGHASHFIERCGSVPNKYEMLEIEKNRSRFALLAIFFGWTTPNVDVRIDDAEFLYDEKSRDVYSIDFGNFFGGPDWGNIDQLENIATPKSYICNKFKENGCELTATDLATACEHLYHVTSEHIASAVAAPPDEWVTIEERAKLANLLYKRKMEICSRTSD